MSHTVAVELAAETLVELVAGLRPGDEIVLTSGARSVARIVPSQPAPFARRPGSCTGMLTVNQEDDDHLAAFAEYMP